MSDNDKPEAAQVENIRRAPRHRRLLGHCLKFWWLYLFLFLAAVVLGVTLT